MIDEQQACEALLRRAQEGGVDLTAAAGALVQQGWDRNIVQRAKESVTALQKTVYLAVAKSGYSVDPLGVYSTEEKAWDAICKWRGPSEAYLSVDVVEVFLDAIPCGYRSYIETTRSERKGMEQ